MAPFSSHLFRLAGALLLAASLVAPAQAQQNVGIGTTTPDAKAALDISATDKGLLVPRLTAAQRAAIAAPPNGLMVFQTDGVTGFWYYFGGAWVNIPNATTAGDNLGNHTASQNLNLGANQLVGNGGTTGLSVSSAGAVKVPQLAGTGPGRLVTLADDGTLLTQPPLTNTTANFTQVAPTALGTTAATGATPVSVAVNAAGTRAYVVSLFSNTLQAYDITNATAPGLVGVAVATGASPQQVVLNAAGTRAYVVNFGSGGIQAYDISNSAVAPVAVGSGVGLGSNPISVALNAAGTRAYVVYRGDNTLQAFDISNPAVAPVAVGAPVATGTAPYYVTVNAAGTRAYVVNQTSNTLQAYDISNPAVAPVAVGAPVATGTTPLRVVVNAAGTRAYVINNSSATLQAYDISNPAVAPVAVGAAVSTGTSATSLAINAAGTRVYVGSSIGNTLRTYDVSNPAVAPVAVGAAVTTTRPTDVTLNATGTRAYVTNNTSNTLQVFTVGTAPLLLAQGADGSLGSIDAATLADNLGNHTAILNLNLGTNKLVGGGTTGLSVSNAGAVTADNGLLVPAGGATLTGPTNINTTGAAATNVGTGATAGDVTIGRAGSTTTINGTTSTPALQVTGGTPGAGRVLTSDATGNATWQAVPSSADNLGNHTATQALNLGTNKLTGGGGAGLSVSNAGAVTTDGTLTTGGAITAGGNVNLAANKLVGNGGTTGLSISNGGALTTDAALTTGGAITAGGNVNLGTNQLVGNGGTTGISVSSAGAVKVTQLAGTGPGRLVTLANDGTLLTQPPPFSATATSPQQPVAVGAAVATGFYPGTVAVNAAGTRAYVLNQLSYTLQAYDISNPAVAPVAVGAAVATGATPSSVAVNAAGTRAYVLSFNSNTLQAYDISNPAVAPVAVGAAVATGNLPQSVAVNATGTRAYVLNYGSNTLQAYDISNPAVAPVAVGAAVATGVGPVNVAVNAAGTRAYVVHASVINPASNTLQTYDISNPAVAPVAVGAAVATGTYPSSVAVNAAGTRAYVVSQASNTLQAYDISNLAGAPVAVGAAVTTGINPISVVVNATSTRAYVVNINNNTLQAYDISNLAGAPVAVGAAVATGANPISVAVNAASTRAYVVNSSSNTLQAYTIGAAPLLLAQGTDGSLGSIDPATLADNLGNHTATQDLNLGANRMTGSGAAGTPAGTGLGLASDGQLRVSTTNIGSGSSNWIAANLGAATGDRVVAGLLFGKATIGAHNNGLSAWADLGINVGGGNVGIGTSTPSQKLSVAGNICYTGTIGACSDRRYKERFQPLTGALANVLQLQGWTYYWRQAAFPEKQFSAERQLGFIAQDIERLYPEMVLTDAQGYKSVDYGRLTPVLVEAIKELQAQLSAARAEAQASTQSFEQRLRALEAGNEQARK